MPAMPELSNNPISQLFQVVAAHVSIATVEQSHNPIQMPLSGFKYIPYSLHPGLLMALTLISRRVQATLPIVLGGMALFATLSAQAATALVLNCPASLQISESAQPSAGWQLVQGKDPHGFAGLGIFSGPPQDMVNLAPNTQRRNGKQLQSVWRLQGGSDKHWLACNYQQTTAQLGQRLPPGMKQCTATHSAGPAGRGTLETSPELRCE